MVGFSEPQKVASINKVFADSYKSPLSVIVVDNLERLLGERHISNPRTLNPHSFQIGHRSDPGSPTLFYKPFWSSLAVDRQR